MWFHNDLNQIPHSVQLSARSSSRVANKRKCKRFFRAILRSENGNWKSSRVSSSSRCWPVVIWDDEMPLTFWYLFHASQRAKLITCWKKIMHTTEYGIDGMATGTWESESAREMSQVNNLLLLLFQTSFWWRRTVILHTTRYEESALVFGALWGRQKLEKKSH